MRLRIVAVTLLFAVGGCASPIGLAGITGRPMDATPTGIVHLAAGSDTDGSTVTDPATGGSTTTGPAAPAPGSGTAGSTVAGPLMPESVPADPVRADPAPAAPAAGAPPVAGPETPAAKPGAVQQRRPESDFPLPPPARPVNCRQIKCVALTFDDGPGPYTGLLLDILVKYQARATFFVLGRMVAVDHRDSLYRMVAEGHEVGNHTWDHLDLTGLPEAEIIHQLRRTQEIVRHAIGFEMTLMRPPYGSTNTRVTDVSRREGLAQVLWNVDTVDWRDRRASIVTERAADVEPGSIVLMHDIYPSTVMAVPRLLNELTAKGYTFVTIPELYGEPLTGGPVRSLDIPRAAMARLRALDGPAHGPRGRPRP
ncbi:Peptidoglycan/xylan/chitin deacetylase, PgdA/CDA1 family [Streptosporangium subroseum]|uniref:Peptidoglycan/xylan/chitin deacetylase, PgdA/CDA1 family n=2 Tax=Streptosporangium subroseum TaxID=106412 RepID=A0A239HXT8_9ACTN|nr:Peptidoglycan/xylan/chitin deacetylase, PgdA/CDA1 family [Streptosporangium subroseum]